MKCMSAAVILMVLASSNCGCERGPAVRARAVGGGDFARYRTYAIKPGNVIYPGAPAEQREEIERRIQDAVAAELEARGLTPQPDEPDLVVTYTAGAQRAGAGGGTPPRAPVGVDVRGPTGGGYDEPGAVTAREWPDASADLADRRQYTGGNLVIDLLDGQTRKLVWRATAADLEIASDRGARRIVQAVARAFERYPVARGREGGKVTRGQGDKVTRGQGDQGDRGTSR
jgi:hypothetical protein